MELFKIDITSWTASFRYPNLISGFQPSLEVPPISTILGLINAAMGSYQKYNSFMLGYYFDYQSKAVDLETIYQMHGKNGTTSNQASSNVIRREFLFETFLRIYVQDRKVADSFLAPIYPLLLGRMNDLATVESISEIKLEQLEHAQKIKGQLIPFSPYHLAGQIQALPKYFTDTFPRNNLGTEAYSIINCRASDFKYDTNINGYRDNTLEKPVDIFMHNLTI